MTGHAPIRPRSLWARIVRRVATFALALLGLVAGAAAVSVLLINTDWGRERLRRVTESLLGSLFAGTVSVGELTGPPLSRMRVSGLALRGQGGQPQLALGPVEVAWSPAALVHKRILVRELLLDHPVVRGRLLADGTLDLASLLRKQGPPAAASAPSAWTVVVEHVSVRDGVVALPVGAKELSLEGPE